MKKKLLFLLPALALAGFICLGCKPSGSIDEEEQENLSGGVLVENNMIFDSRPALTVHIENPNKVKMEAKVKLSITTDMGNAVATLEKTVNVGKKGTADIPFTTETALEPGFYKADCYINGVHLRGSPFGIDPFHIVSAPDMQSDFNGFWETAINQLPPINEGIVRMVEIPKRSNDNCKVYFVELLSVPDGPDTDPVKVRGYYLEPRDGKKHPVIMHFQGYDTNNNPSKIYTPYGNAGDYAEFYLSHRGQYINSRTAAKRDDGIEEDFENIYGDWFAYNFGNKDGYYYRGAFMDCVQAVRFMSTRSACDMNNLFAEGSSQGGALCYACAALSDYPFTAIAPNVAFLGDFPDYFKIVGWPGNVAKENQGSMTDEQMYAFLSYFDTKNLATRISCAVYATSGLRDGTCPPHTNVAPYNNLLSTDKQMFFYPEMTHDYPPNWNNDIMKFFKAHIH